MVMLPDHNESRDFERYHLPARVTLFPPTVEGRLMDLSLGGCRVWLLSRHPGWRRGDEVHFVLDAPEMDGRVVKGRAVIRWLGEREVGLQFRAVANEDNLIAWVQALVTSSLNSAYWR